MSREIAKKPPASNFTDAEVELGLRAYALCSGNRRRAVRLLAEQGVRIGDGTLRSWAESNHERLSVIEDELLPQIQAEIARRSEAIALRASEMEMKLLDRTDEKFEELEPRDITNALRNVSTTKGINVDKANVNRGRPTEIRETRDVADILKVLATKFGDVVKVDPELIDGEAKEIEAA